MLPSTATSSAVNGLPSGPLVMYCGRPPPARRTRDEFAVGVGEEHRDVRDVLVPKIQAEHGPCLGLDRGPRRHAGPPVGRAGVGPAGGEPTQELAGRLRLPADEAVLTEE